MTKTLLGGLAVCAAALTLAACQKPAEPAAAAPAADAAAPAAAAPAAEPAPGAPPAGTGALPADVAALQAQFETCVHFAGEEPYDADRRKQIEAGIEENCKPVKAAIPSIEAKYKDNAAVQAVVKDWHEQLDAYDG